MDTPAENPESSQPGGRRPGAPAGTVATGEFTQHITDVFDLRDESLRGPESRLWSPLRIAAALGVSMEEFAGMLAVSNAAIHETPDAPEVQARLAPFANILAMAHDYYAGDENRTRGWLIQPQARLGGRSPLDALRIPGRAPLLEQWMAGIWLGDGE